MKKIGPTVEHPCLLGRNGAKLTDEQVRRRKANLVGFFTVLSEWAANDNVPSRPINEPHDQEERSPNDE
jgi:hypothetical protein